MSSNGKDDGELRNLGHTWPCEGLQEFPNMFASPQVQFLVHNSLPLVPILSQMAHATSLTLSMQFPNRLHAFRVSNCISILLTVRCLA
jgi:hypothetical protein